MLDKAMTAFVDKATLADAWGEYFSPDDIIGLKINANSLRDFRGTEVVSHYTSLASAIIEGCRKAGIKGGNFVIWERSEQELDNAGFKVGSESGSPRVLGTKKARRESGGIGFASEASPVGDHSTHVSRILTDICTSMINIPVLKDHRQAGITGALKNHYGSIDNPFEFHDNGCTGPGIPEINAIPVIRKKQRLIIGDMLFCVYNGGPRWRREYFWPCGKIIVGTDPVAVDRVMMKLLDEKRRLEDLPPVEPRAGNLALSEKLGLGTANPDKIDLVEIEMG
jgi:uncharacterized protein (DUF362 family)